MKRGQKHKFQFVLHLFDRRGKPVAERHYEYVVATVSDLSGKFIRPYMPDVVSHLRGIRDTGPGFPGWHPDEQFTGSVLVMYGDEPVWLIPHPTEVLCAATATAGHPGNAPRRGSTVPSRRSPKTRAGG